MSKLYTFRETTDKKELESCFRLRYKMYSATSNKVFISQNNSEIDVDLFDLHARHYLLMHNAGIAAYMRVILPRQQFTNTNVIDIREKYLLLNRDETSLNTNTVAPFPFLSYDGVPESHWDYYRNLLTQNKYIIEASRLIISPEFTSIKMARQMVECAMVAHILPLLQKKMVAIVNCNTRHMIFYKTYGFNEINNAATFITNGLTKVSLSLNAIPEQHHKKLGLMANHFHERGEIVLSL